MLRSAHGQADRGVRGTAGRLAGRETRDRRGADRRRTARCSRPRQRRVRDRGRVPHRHSLRGDRSTGTSDVAEVLPLGAASASASASAAASAARSSAPALEIRGLNKVFFQGGGPEPIGLLVLDRVTLTVGDGEFVSVLGPSGCGKTTLARIVVGHREAPRRRSPHRRQAGGSARRRSLPGVPELRAAAVAHRAKQRRAGAGDPGHCPAATRQRDGSRVHRAGWPDGLREPLSAPDLGRHAAARRAWLARSRRGRGC